MESSHNASETARARRVVEAELSQPKLLEATRAFLNGELAAAERKVRLYLKVNPDSVGGLSLLADIAERCGVYLDAAKLLDRVLALLPAFTEARMRRANLAFQMGARDEALGLLDEVSADDEVKRQAGLLKARFLGLTGSYSAAEAIYRSLLESFVDDPVIWCALGDVLKTLGRSQESLSCFRRVLDHNPDYTLAWWSIANLKSARFTPADVATMEAILPTAVDELGRLHLRFALGQAYEQLEQAEQAFEHYAAGNSIRLKLEPYNRNALSAQVGRTVKLFSRQFLEEREGCGDDTLGPIFIVGLPRAGSTLLEQMLASHPLIEGTSELADIPLLIQHLLSSHLRQTSARYPDILAQVPIPAWKELGARYLRAAASHRKTNRPYFIDKLPNNWINVGFIYLILPNAKIIDARRSPLACCFSNFKQHFSKGQDFTYDLTDIGQYYRDYVRLMRHFDGVLPGRIARVLHEDLVVDPEVILRNLVQFLGIEFESSMLEFHRNERAVRTASAEQVRAPIDRTTTEKWQIFEPWLDPLKAALGPALTEYR